MSAGTAIFLVGALFALVTLVPDFIAHVARYMRERRKYPYGSRGHQWRGTK